MSASIELSRVAANALRRLHRDRRSTYDRVARALERLADEPLLGKPLQGPLAGRRSLRVGSYRVVYRFEAERVLVLVLDIADRRQVYR